MEKIESAIKAKTDENNKLSCKDALRIANELNVSPGTVGKAANNLKVKIKGCQLGCF
jgi:Mn-dependent DtxR family transcriptional regulator